MVEARITTDRDRIRDWVETRGGRPARVQGTGAGGVLRIDFGEPEEGLEQISWDDFFAVFEDRGLAFLYQERTMSGDVSRFNKIVTKPH